MADTQHWQHPMNSCLLGKTIMARTGQVMAAAFGIALVLAVLALRGGATTHALRVALKATGLWSFFLFWPAYAGSALADVSGLEASWLRRGREWGLAFASAHLVHVALVIWLYQLSPQPPIPFASAVFFGIGVGFTYLLAGLSWKPCAARVGSAARPIRQIGMNYILAAFGFDFVVGPLLGGQYNLGRIVQYLPPASLLLAAPMLRVARTVRESIRAS
jgi:hypothetical protein